MLDNSLAVIDNLAIKAPWLVENEELCNPTEIKKSSLQIINDIRNHHLTIITNKGRVYRQYLTINIENGK